MLFPTSPTNGQQVTINYTTYQYDSSNTAWYRIPAPVVAVSMATNGILYNSNTISSSITFSPGFNGLSVGPLTVEDGVTVTMQPGSRHVII